MYYDEDMVSPAGDSQYQFGGEKSKSKKSVTLKSLAKSKGSAGQKDTKISLFKTATMHRALGQMVKAIGADWSKKRWAPGAVKMISNGLERHLQAIMDIAGKTAQFGNRKTVDYLAIENAATITGIPVQSIRPVRVVLHDSAKLKDAYKKVASKEEAGEEEEETGSKKMKSSVGWDVVRHVENQMKSPGFEGQVFSAMKSLFTSVNMGHMKTIAGITHSKKEEILAALVLLSASFLTGIVQKCMSILEYKNRSTVDVKTAHIALHGEGVESVGFGSVARLNRQRSDRKALEKEKEEGTAN